MQRLKKLKIYEPIDKSFNADSYILHEGLQNAIEVATALDQPLLLTGEPGTGKTKLAYKLANMLHTQKPQFLKEPLRFNTKTSSIARDLFYTYDALGHFQAANIKQDGHAIKTTADYIKLQALGEAIAQTDPQQVTKKVFKNKLKETPKSSVVLIDEIDKAPRDFSNDILHEIENYQFKIKEQDGKEIKKGKEQRIIVIMTSNSEKNLPNAFLRRCVFYHIPFPDDELLLQIVKAQISKQNQEYKYTDAALKSIINQFGEIRKKSICKKPATAELVAWIRMLGINGYMEKGTDELEKGTDEQKQLMRQNLSILVKTQEDLKAIKQLIDEVIS